jgi:hypothetical protein
MQSEYDELNNYRVNRLQLCIYIGIGLFISLHIILMSVLVSNLVSIAPEVQTTLADVKILVPQMHKTLVELGRMLPEIKTGMDVLKQLCEEAPNCSYS